MSFSINVNIKNKNQMATAVSLTSEEKVSFQFAPATPKGTPGLIDGTVTAVVESGSATVEFDTTDPMKGFILSGDTAEESIIRFSADADVSAGVRTIEEVVTVTVTDPLVTTLGFVLGTPEAK